MGKGDADQGEIDWTAGQETGVSVLPASNWLYV